METKVRVRQLEMLKYILGFTGCLALNSEGKSGGIRLLWSKDVDLEIYLIQNIILMHEYVIKMNIVSGESQLCMVIRMLIGERKCGICSNVFMICLKDLGCVLGILTR